uniref:PDZ domain-containing protein n=1 Tax=Caenorhabditis japonica TaxID=281687 RepID=A0A8R1E5S9_CAEJA
MKLGMNMHKVDKKILINYTIPDSVSHCALNIGENILAVDDHPVATLEEVRQRILDGCNVNGYAKVLVEFPTADMVRNQIRNMLQTAAKEEQPPLICSWCRTCANIRKRELMC